MIVVDPTIAYLGETSQDWVEPIGTTRVSFLEVDALALAVDQRSDAFIDVDFGAAMKDDADLVDPASYDLNASIGVGVGVTIVAVTRINSTSIRLEVSLGTNGQPYQFTVIGDVRLATGEAVAGETATYLAKVHPPLVATARATGSHEVEVTFSRAMTNNVDLHDPTKYKFTDGLFASSVERTGAATVVVTTSAQIDGVNYSLRVFP